MEIAQGGVPDSEFIQALFVQDFQRGGPQRKPSSPGNVKVELAAASVPHPAVTHRPGQPEAAGWPRPSGGAPEQAAQQLHQGSPGLPLSALDEPRGQPAHGSAPEQRGQLEMPQLKPSAVSAAPPQELAPQQQEQLQQH